MPLIIRCTASIGITEETHTEAAGFRMILVNSGGVQRKWDRVERKQVVVIFLLH